MKPTLFFSSGKREGFLKPKKKEKWTNDKNNSKKKHKEYKHIKKSLRVSSNQENANLNNEISHIQLGNINCQKCQVFMKTWVTRTC